MTQQHVDQAQNKDAGNGYEAMIIAYTTTLISTKKLPLWTKLCVAASLELHPQYMHCLRSFGSCVGIKQNIRG